MSVLRAGLSGGVLPGLRAGMPYAVACLLLGVSFGVLARPVMDPDAVIVMSMVVQLHPGLARVIPLLAPALLAALVVTETGGGSGRSLVIDARVGGLLAAAAAISRRWPLAVVVSCAAGTTAFLRAFG